MKTYTKDQFISYVCGWLGANEANKDQLSLNNMNAALLNASTMLKDHQDGIDAQIERNKKKYYRFEGKYTKQLECDDDAFEEAVGYHDDRSATVEKWIDGRWCPCAYPLYHPSLFEGDKNGGWMTLTGLVEFDEPRS